MLGQYMAGSGATFGYVATNILAPDCFMLNIYFLQILHEHRIRHQNRRPAISHTDIRQCQTAALPNTKEIPEEN